MGYGVRKIGVLPALVLAVSGCSTGSDVQGAQQEAPASQVFSEEDKRVARLLSIGSEVRNRDATPHFEAMLCTLALETVAARLQDSDLMSPQQLQLFEQAQSLYRQRAAAGFSDEERAKTRRDVEATYPEQGDRARFAIGCLRELA